MVGGTKRAVAALGLAAGVLAAQACGAPRPELGPRKDAPPNVVVILADDLGWGDVGSFGAKEMRTPNIDGLVQAGIRMDRFYANSTVCSPTRAALLTGRYPDLVGVPGVIRTDPRNSWGYLSSRARLLPELLRKAGYHSAIVGKWHLGLESPNTPTERGFDEFAGFLGDMMDDYVTHLRHGKNYMRRNQLEIDPNGHATDLFTRWAVQYLNDRRKDGRPFFLYLAYNAPHVPIQPPPEWLQRVKKRQPELDERRAKIVALIEHMDDGVGEVVQALKANGQFERTLLIFTSDNGGQTSAGASVGGLRGGKEDLFEGGLRVPLCAVLPGHLPAGARSERVALSMDLFPTILDAAGVASERAIDGVSLLPELEAPGGRDASPERDIFFMRREGGPKYRGRDYYAVRRGAWKLLQNTPFEPYRLYNLETDPLEERDTAVQNPKVVADLMAAISAHVQEAGRVPWQKPAD